MAGSGSGRDQTSNDPTGNFGGSGLPQFGSSYYPIDTELTNPSASYNLPTYARQLEDAATSEEKIEHGNMNNIPIDANGAAPSSVLDPAMAPPQTPSQPAFMPTGGRSSLDASAETPQEPQTGDKRKRSKASRACDECRRKKVKCDAPTEADGTPKTCTNCQKAGVNCEFERKPMKRGPSKGYISQLAERVQGLEQKQRQSLDAGQGGFAESFSPDDQTGSGFQNRAPSFSAPANFNPFSRVEYQRDRIPSVGWTAQSPGSALRSRAIGSLAIAPHESFPTSFLEEAPNLKFQVRDPSQSFFGEIFGARPSKRQRTQAPDDDMPAVQALNLDDAFLSNYYQQYHPLVALLPESRKVIAIVSEADPVMQHAFITAIELLPDLRAAPTVNGNHDTNMTVDPAIDVPRKSLKSDRFPTYDALQQYLFAQGTGTALHRTEEENLTMVWTMALLAMGAENHVKLLKNSSPLSKSVMLPLARFVLEQVRTDNAGIPTSVADRPRQTTYPDEVTQAHNCLGVMIQYHALGVGLPASGLVPANYPVNVRDFDAKKTTPEAAYLASSSNLVELLCHVVLEGESTREIRALGGFLLQRHFDTHLSLYGGSLRDTSIANQLHCFLELIIAPFPYLPPGASAPLFPVVSALTWADKLTTVLIGDAQATSAAPRYSPLDMHTWSLATTSLCLFATDASTRALAEFAVKRLDELRAELQKKSDAFHRTFGLEWFFGGRMEPWADVLLAMIDQAKGRAAAAAVGDGGHDVVAVPNMEQVMMNGLLNGVLFFAKNM
ncbi:hypothetical protein CLCR_11396 [Cladophialophora carrionii]|uniref:Zn(2)-C6 fungal-type domain-containing protein n=1 Tax=Cladophialophora carrionii TaxID=86049 RepID=A0A1C1CXI2_9EURO|nr:hypothetical protein CLCR_11396 [Cladophialophora carrionii]